MEAKNKCNQEASSAEVEGVGSRFYRCEERGANLGRTYFLIEKPLRGRGIFERSGDSSLCSE